MLRTPATSQQANRFQQTREEFSCPAEGRAGQGWRAATADFPKVAGRQIEFTRTDVQRFEFTDAARLYLVQRINLLDISDSHIREAPCVAVGSFEGRKNPLLFECRKVLRFAASEQTQFLY